MEPTVPYNDYRIRIDGKDDETLIAFCDKFVAYLLVHHEPPSGENPHYHAYVKTHFSQGNFSNKIKRDLGVSGSDYSNKKCDSERKSEFLSYCFNTKKGNVPRLVSQKGFTDEEIQQYKDNAKTVQDNFDATSRKTKKTQYEIAEIVLAIVKSNPHKHMQTDTITWIYDLTLEQLKIHKMIARPFHMRDIVSHVMSYSNDPNLKHRIKCMSLKNILET